MQSKSANELPSCGLAFYTELSNSHQLNQVAERSMSASLRVLAVLCAIVTTAMPVFSQQDKSQLPRQMAPYLFRVSGDYDLPKALVVPEGQAPEYSLSNLAEWRCDGNVNPEALPTCGSYFISRKPIALKQKPVLKEKAGDVYGHTRYAVETIDGLRLDVWTTEFGCDYSPDGSRLRVGLIEDRLKDLRSPWGPEPYNNISYNNMLYPGEMPYLQRVAPDGRVLWAYVYLVRTMGHTTDKTNSPLVTNPLLGFGEVVCPKGSGAIGFLASAVTRSSTFSFGSLALQIDTFTGQPKVTHPRIRVVPATEIEQHFRRALAELIKEGVVTEKDTQITTEPYGGVSPPSRFLSKDNELSERIQRNILKAYFIDKKTGSQKMTTPRAGMGHGTGLAWRG